VDVCALGIANHAYTRLLRYALNVSWDDFTTNQELYGNLEPVSTRLRKHRLAFIGHSHVDALGSTC